MSVTKTVRRSIGPRKMSLRRPRAAGLAAGRTRPLPHLRLLDAPPHPGGRQGGQDADEERGSPAPDRQHQLRDDGGGREADRPRALHDPERLAAVFGRPGLGHQRGPARPLATHADPEQGAEQHQVPGRLCETAGAGEHRVDQDAADQGAGAAVAVGNHAEQDSAERGGDERGRPDQPRHPLAEPEVRHHGRQHQRVEVDVERIEHPAQAGGAERAPRLRRGLAVPGERSGGRHARR